MACSHGETVDECDQCVAEAQRRAASASNIQRAAESRRIRGGNKPPEDKSKTEPKTEPKHRKK